MYPLLVLFLPSVPTGFAGYKIHVSAWKPLIVNNCKAMHDSLEKVIMDLHPMKYFSTRGGNERLSFEEVNTTPFILSKSTDF
jgi:hypothetical protein